MLRQTKPVAAKSAASKLFSRFTPGEVVGAVEFPAGPSGDAEHWVPCGCGVGPLSGGPYAARPASGSCRTCGDKGWMFTHVTASPAVSRPYFIAAPGLSD